jgi:hypothetical protein
MTWRHGSRAASWAPRSWPTLLPRSARRTFREAVGDVDDDTWARSEGWALLLAMVYLANSADHPLLARVGEQVLADLLA